MATHPNPNLLRQFAPFAEVESERLEKLVSSLKFHRFEQGRTLFKRNDTGKSLFLLIRGEVCFYARNDDENSELHTAMPSDIFGEVAVFGGGFRTAKAQAKTEVEVWELESRHLDTILSEFPELARYLIERMAWRLENSGTQLHLNRQTLRSRIDSDRTVPEKYVAGCVESMGTLRFILFSLLVILIWAGLSYSYFRAHSIADAPYTLLGLLLSCVSLFFSMLVLSCQNRNEKDNKIRDQHFGDMLLGTHQIINEMLKRIDAVERHLSSQKSDTAPLNISAVVAPKAVSTTAQ